MKTLMPYTGILTGTGALKNNLALLTKVDIFGNSAPCLGNSPRDHNIRVEDMQLGHYSTVSTRQKPECPSTEE